MTMTNDHEIALQTCVTQSGVMWLLKIHRSVLWKSHSLMHLPTPPQNTVSFSGNLFCLKNLEVICNHWTLYVFTFFCTTGM